jgi:hypothetical protein
MFFRKKEKLDVDDLAKAFLSRYVKSLICTFSPDEFPWLTHLARQAGQNTFNREWLIMHMFLISETFSVVFAGNETGGRLVNRINNIAFEGFADDGLFEKDHVHALVANRYVQYFEGCKMSTDLTREVALTFLQILNLPGDVAAIPLMAYLIEEHANAEELARTLAEAIR